MEIIHGDCLIELPKIADQSIDAVITDPPYPEIKRDYGKWSEQDWHTMMNQVVKECQRILKPTGSAVFILQPNSRHIGEMRLWLWEFLIRTAKEWNLIQDVYWWNWNALPCCGCDRKNGLMRPSVKYCLWFGNPNCYRNQDAVLWNASDAIKAQNKEDRALTYFPSGAHLRKGIMAATVEQRGGTTPFNLLPISGSGQKGHGAGTPQQLANWWIKYITKETDTILDPFAGVFSIPLCADKLNRKGIGIERIEDYCTIARHKL